MELPGPTCLPHLGDLSALQAPSAAPVLCSPLAGSHTLGFSDLVPSVHCMMFSVQAEASLPPCPVPGLSSAYSY